MIKYKLIDTDGYTRRGQEGETYWLDGLDKIAVGDGAKLCTEDLIHWYDHPLLAVLFNPIHADIKNPKLIAIEIDKEIAHDGLKGGCKRAKYLEEITLPEITIDQKVEFAIRISLKVHKEEKYKDWANNWLSGTDRTERAAWSAAGSAAASAELFLRTIKMITSGEKQ